MRKQVVRLFLTFALVIAVVLASQASAFLISVNLQRKAWINSVFDDYLTTVTTSLQEGLTGQPTSFINIEQILLASLDDRISGLYLRNPDGSVAVAYGSTSSGNTLPLPLGFRADPRRFDTKKALLPLVDSHRQQSFRSQTMRCDLYQVDIVVATPVSTITVSKERKMQNQTITLPPQVKATDIAGSMSITYNGEPLGSVDVLTYTPSTYKQTTKLFRGLLASFIISLPAALIIALVMAASLSRRTQRYTDGIQRALEQLSEGENNVALPKTNIDEQRIINASIAELDETLLRNRESRQAWLRAISHDLNTPVTGMKLLIDGMVDGIFPSEGEYLTKLQMENDHLAAKISHVALYSTLQGPDVKVQIEEVAIDLLISESLMVFSPEEQKRISIDESGAALTADLHLLSHAVRALLSNALEATGTTVQWKIGANYMVFTNEGTLPPSIDFFEPWSRGDSSRHTPGSGLGLPIVYQIMRLHRGSAMIAQEGETVVVTLQW
jgi:signal transduction histidine kinase